MFAKELEDLMLKYDVSIYRVFDDENLTRIEFFFREKQKLRACVLEQKSCEDAIVYEVKS